MQNFIEYRSFQVAILPKTDYKICLFLIEICLFNSHNDENICCIAKLTSRSFCFWTYVRTEPGRPWFSKEQTRWNQLFVSCYSNYFVKRVGVQQEWIFIKFVILPPLFWQLLNIHPTVTWKVFGIYSFLCTIPWGYFPTLVDPEELPDDFWRTMDCAFGHLINHHNKRWTLHKVLAKCASMICIIHHVWQYPVWKA